MSKVMIGTGLLIDDNHSFGWHEGAYFYMPQTWWEDVA